jgi:predicted transcriptional regulator
MRESERSVAITVRVSPETHRALQGLAQREHRSLAGQVAHLLEQALAVEPRVRRSMEAELAAHWARQARGLDGGDADAAPARDDDEDAAGGADTPRPR